MKTIPVAFVAGATGYVGRSVVDFLCKIGIQTYAHVRPDSPFLDMWKTHFQEIGAQVDTTIWEYTSFHSTFERIKPTLVFSLLGTTQARKRQGDSGAIPPTYGAVDCGLTHLLMQASMASDSRFIYLSSVGVTGEEPKNQYLRIRWRIEAELDASGMPHVIVRPAFISGSDRDERRMAERTGAVVGDFVLGTLKYFGAHQLYAKYTSISGQRLGKVIVEQTLATTAHRVIVEGKLLREK